jgi:hypothetical protein
VRETKYFNNFGKKRSEIADLETESERLKEVKLEAKVKALLG